MKQVRDVIQSVNSRNIHCKNLDNLHLYFLITTAKLEQTSFIPFIDLKKLRLGKVKKSEPV